jgi:hypothetical protein
MNVYSLNCTPSSLFMVSIHTTSPAAYFTNSLQNIIILDHFRHLGLSLYLKAKWPEKYTCTWPGNSHALMMYYINIFCYQSHKTTFLNQYVTCPCLCNGISYCHSERVFLSGLWSWSWKEFLVELDSVKMYRLRPQFEILTRHSKFRVLIPTITIRFIL